MNKLSVGGISDVGSGCCRDDLFFREVDSGKSQLNGNRFPIRFLSTLVSIFLFLP